MEAQLPFEQSSDSSSESSSEHKTSFLDHKTCRSILTNLRSILKMRIKRVDCCGLS